MAIRRSLVQRIGASSLVGAGIFTTTLLLAPQIHAQGSLILQQRVATLMANERNAARQKPPFLYTSIERSDRTHSHLWTERVAEIPQGKLRYLIAEDGKPLSADRRNAEIGRLKVIADNPDDFIRHEQFRRNDEQHAQQMLELLPRAFLFDSPGNDGPWLRINYRPNPAYIPQTFEERVLHGMSGTMLIDERTMRLHDLEGNLRNEVTYGFGLLATIHKGSSFATTRDQIAPNIWKTTSVDIHFDGRAVFFKTISRHQHSIRRDFKALPGDLSIPRAIELLTR
jgi:hypothetical protein